MLLAEMTDGHLVVNAIEYQPMGPELHEDIPPGTKVGGAQYIVFLDASNRWYYQ